MNKGLNPAVNFECMVCRCDTSTEYYMVHDHLWRIAIDGLPDRVLKMHRGRIYGGSFLCIGCIEKRLDRKLTAADFSPALCNSNRDWYKNTDRLLNRLAS